MERGVTDDYTDDRDDDRSEADRALVLTNRSATDTRRDAFADAPTALPDIYHDDQEDPRRPAG